MKLRRPAPPYNQSPGGGRCFESCLKSCIEHFEPDSGITFDEVDRLTGYLPDKDTWPMRAFVEMARRGYDVVVYEAVDYPAFIEDPMGYLTHAVGAKAAQTFDECSSVAQAVEDAQELLRAEPDLPNLTRNTTPPTQQDLERLIDDGYLCICGIDIGLFVKGNDEIWSHAVLIYDYDEDQVFGLDSRGFPYERMSKFWDRFESAWNSPSEASKLLMALKKPRDA